LLTLFQVTLLEPKMQAYQIQTISGAENNGCRQGSDWRRRPSATKWRPCCPNTKQFKRKNGASQWRYASFECYCRRTAV